MSSNGLFMTVYHYAYKCDDDSQGRGLYYKTFFAVVINFVPQ
jgi:hypothetical protein